MLTWMVSISWPRNPPASPSQSAGIIGVSHCAQLLHTFMSGFWSQAHPQKSEKQTKHMLLHTCTQDMHRQCDDKFLSYSLLSIKTSSVTNSRRTNVTNRRQGVEGDIYLWSWYRSLIDKAKAKFRMDWRVIDIREGLLNTGTSLTLPLLMWSCLWDY